MRKPDHPQLPFTTIYGQPVTVDEEIWDILVAFKRIGVVTLYSCQGDKEQHGYISALRPGMNRFLKAMFSVVDNPEYSQESRDFISGFKNGYQETSIALRFQDGTYQVWDCTFSKGYRDSQAFQIEKDWSNDHKPRVVIRWPYDKNETFLKLLREMHA